MNPRQGSPIEYSRQNQTLKWTDYDGDQGIMTCDPEELDGDAVVMVGSHELHGGSAGIYLTKDQVREVILWLRGVIDE